MSLPFKEYICGGAKPKMREGVPVLESVTEVRELSAHSDALGCLPGGVVLVDAPETVNIVDCAKVKFHKIIEGGKR